MSVLEVIEAVTSMTPPEREQVRTVLQSLADSVPPGDEAVRAGLRAAGLLLQKKSGSVTPLPPFTPVEIRGRPLSETVIEERR